MARKINYAKSKQFSNTLTRSAYVSQIYTKSEEKTYNVKSQSDLPATNDLNLTVRTKGCTQNLHMVRTKLGIQMHQ